MFGIVLFVLGIINLVAILNLSNDNSISIDVNINQTLFILTICLYVSNIVGLVHIAATIMQRYSFYPVSFRTLSLGVFDRGSIVYILCFVLDTIYIHFIILSVIYCFENFDMSNKNYIHNTFETIIYIFYQCYFWYVVLFVCAYSFYTESSNITITDPTRRQNQSCFRITRTILYHFGSFLVYVLFVGLYFTWHGSIWLIETQKCFFLNKLKSADLAPRLLNTITGVGSNGEYIMKQQTQYYADFWKQCKQFVDNCREYSFEYSTNEKNSDIRTFSIDKEQDRLLRLCCINYIALKYCKFNEDVSKGEINDEIDSIYHNYDNNVFKKPRKIKRKKKKRSKTDKSSKNNEINNNTDKNININNNNIESKQNEDINVETGDNRETSLAGLIEESTIDETDEKSRPLLLAFNSFDDNQDNNNHDSNVLELERKQEPNDNENSNILNINIETDKKTDDNSNNQIATYQAYQKHLKLLQTCTNTQITENTDEFDANNGRTVTITTENKSDENDPNLLVIDVNGFKRQRQEISFDLKKQIISERKRDKQFSNFIENSAYLSYTNITSLDDLYQHCDVSYFIPNCKYLPLAFGFNELIAAQFDEVMGMFEIRIKVAQEGDFPFTEYEHKMWKYRLCLAWIVTYILTPFYTIFQVSMRLVVPLLYLLYYGCYSVIYVFRLYKTCNKTKLLNHRFDTTQLESKYNKQP